MNEELNKRICKVCQELKDRITAGKFNHKDKKFVDADNKLWNGNVCPKCVVAISRERMRHIRSVGI